MDTEVIINGELYVFIKLSEAQAKIVESLISWNNFESDKPLEISIRKITPATSTLGAHVEESLIADDIFGRA